MAFNVIDVETGILVRDGRFIDGVVQYNTAEQATVYAKSKGASDGRKYKIKAVTIDDSWKRREYERFCSGHYMTVPWSQGRQYFWAANNNAFWYQMASVNPMWTSHRPQDYGSPTHSVFGKYFPLWGKYAFHFPHVSQANRMMLAFTESPEKGAKDIQTQIKPGTYLKRFYGEYLSDDEIRAIVMEWTRIYSDAELCFARTPDEIVSVYQTGPNSCMSGQANQYRTRAIDNVSGNAHFYHPCEVYGQPHSDLTLAYTKNKGGIAARCLVWEDKKRYGRIYGDPTLIERELSELGYRREEFVDAKLGRVEVRGNNFLMPYIDGWSEVKDMGDHFLLTNNYTAQTKKERCKFYCCSRTDGITPGREVYTCTECGGEVDEGDVYRTNGENYCSDCHSELFAYCDRTGNYYPCDEVEEVFRFIPQSISRYGTERGGYWTSENWGPVARQGEAFYCEVMERWYRSIYRVHLPDGRTVSQEAINNDPSLMEEKAKA